MSLTKTSTPEHAPAQGSASPPPGASTRRRAAIIGLILTVATAAALSVNYVRRQSSHASAVAGVRTAMVIGGSLEKTLRLTGSTSAEKSVYMRTPRMRGQRTRGGGSDDFRLFLATLASSGARVKAGDRVASFDSIYMQNRYDDLEAERADEATSLQVVRQQAKLALAAQQQALLVAKAALDKAVLDMKTAEVRSAIEVENFRLSVEENRALYKSLLAQSKFLERSSQADVREAELSVEESAVEAQRAKLNLERLDLKSPIDGLVVISEMRRGAEIAQVRAGDQLGSGQQFAQVVDAHSILVEAKANQADVESLLLGAPARVRFDSLGGLELDGKLKAIGALATSPGRQSEYLREVTVVVSIDHDDPRLLPNLSASADVVLAREENANIIPLEGIFRDPDSGEAIAYVQTGSKWEKRPIEVGLTNNVAAVVVSGLEPGERIATELPTGAN